MCLILFAYETHPKYRLILAANRDEFYDRPTAPAHQWEDCPNIFAGRDLKSHGTWLGVTSTGRIAAITNYREPQTNKDDMRSRGELVQRFLSQDLSPKQYLETIAKTANQYKGFNLIVGDVSDLYYFSNRGDDIQKIHPGVHGLSNRFLDTPWYKVQKGKQLLCQKIQTDTVDPEQLMAILTDRSVPPDEFLPDTGVGLEWERLLAPIFIISQTYGTRSSSVILIEKNGKILFLEKTFHPELMQINEVCLTPQ